MPPKKQAPKTPRCAYVESGRRCSRAGTGNPPLCEPHRLVLEAEADRPQRPGERLVGVIGNILNRKKITDEQLFGGIEDFVDMFTRSSGDPAHDPIAAARARAAEFMRRAQGQPSGQRRPPPPPPPRKPAGPDPRIVLGFAAGEKVTAEQVKKRHRELARRHHPDRGGSVAKMQEVNAAVDQILATL